MRAAPLLAGLLLLAGLAGCTEPGAVEHTPAEVGQWWTYRMVTDGVGQSLDEAGQPVTQPVHADEQRRDQVVAAGIPSARGPLDILHSRGTGPEVGEHLEARRSTDLATVPVHWHVAQSCQEYDVCLPPVAGIFFGADSFGLPFPLREGDRWREEEVGHVPGLVLEGSVGAVERMQVPAGAWDAVPVTYRIWVEDPDTALASVTGDDIAAGDVQFSYEMLLTYWYAPAVGTAVHAKVSVDGDLRVRQQDGSQAHATFDMEGTLDLLDHGTGTPERMDILAARLDLPSAPPPDGLDRDATAHARVVGLPVRANVGVPVPLAAAVTGPASADATLVWTIRMEGVDGPIEVARSTQRAWSHTFALPGRHELTVQPVDAAGTALGPADRVTLMVDQRLAGQGTCPATLRVDGVLESDGCEGLAFPLPPQTVQVKVRATVPAGQDTIPCSFLGLYRDGQEMARHAAGPLAPPTMDVPAPAEAGASTQWEVRWAPTVAAGGTVDYDVEIVALPPGTWEAPMMSGC